MIWLEVAIAIVIAMAAFYGASFLSTAWRKLKRTESGTQAIAALLPGFDCGLCGHSDCRSYATAIDRERADPALFSSRDSAPSPARREARRSSRSCAARGSALRRAQGRGDRGFPLRRSPELPLRRRAIRRPQTLQRRLPRLRILRGRLPRWRHKDRIRPRRCESGSLHGLWPLCRILPYGRHRPHSSEPVVVYRLRLAARSRSPITGLLVSLFGLRRVLGGLPSQRILNCGGAREGEPGGAVRTLGRVGSPLSEGLHRPCGKGKKTLFPFPRE